MTYVSIQKSQLLDSMENQALYADLCSVVISPSGLGKSFFIEQLAIRLDGQLNLSQIIATPEMTVDQLEKTVSLQLGLSWRQSDDLIERATERFDRRSLVTIDDAHLLTNNCLDYLMTLVANQLAARETKVFLVLAGDARLAKKLNQTEALIDNPNICVVFELQPIEQQETKHLVAHFQSIDVGTAEALYDEQKLDYFWQLSRGNPADLEYQLNRWLTESVVKKDAPQSLPASRKYGLAFLYSLIAVALILTLVFQSDINQLIDSAENNNSPAAIEPVKTFAEPTEGTSLPSTSKKLRLDQEPITINAPDQNVKQAAERSQSVQDQVLTERDSRHADTSSEPAPSSLALEEETPNPVSSKTDSSTRSIDEKAQTSSKVSIPKKQAAKDLAARKDRGADNKNFILTEDEQALMNYADNQYTLQWLGVSSLASAQKFRDEHPLKSQMLVFRRKQSGKILYLLVSGQFNSRDDADHSRVVYQDRGYPGTPWTKSLAAVKKEIMSLEGVNPD